MKNSGLGRDISVILGLLAVSGACATRAAGQQSAGASEESAISEANAEMNMEAGPQQVPGREKGPREVERDETPMVPAPVAPEAADWFGGKSWWEWSRMTGDWGGARTTLEDHGIALNGSYLLDWSSVWSGGLRNVASTRTLLDFNATVDFEKLIELKGGTFFIDFYSTDMRGGSRDVGDFGGIDNAETFKNVDQIAELWYQQLLFDDRVRIKLGKIDANSEFAFPLAGSGVVSSTAAISPTLLGNPTYPDPATGVVLFVYPTDQIYLGGGFFDGATVEGFPTGRRGPATFFSDDQADSWYWIGEVGVTWNELWSLHKGRLAGGVWHHTAEFARFDGGTEDDTTGFYALVEQQIVRRGDSEELEDKGLFVFARYGWADEEVAAAANHVGVGLALFGTFAERDDDEAGVYYSWIDLSDADGSTYEDDEHLLELYYKVQVTPWFSVRPDIQFVFNPGGTSDIDDAVVGMLRFEVTF